MKRFLKGFVLFYLLTASALAQCTGGVPQTTIYTAEWVIRSGSNQVYTLAQSWVTGEYADAWTANVSSTTYVNGSPVHSGTASAINGDVASLVWFDTPSTLGPGCQL